MLLVYSVPLKHFDITFVFGHKECDVVGVLGTSQNIRYFSCIPSKLNNPILMVYPNSVNISDVISTLNQSQSLDFLLLKHSFSDSQQLSSNTSPCTTNATDSFAASSPNIVLLQVMAGRGVTLLLFKGTFCYNLHLR